MPFLHLVAWFFGGAFLANAVPHFVMGTIGRPYRVTQAWASAFTAYGFDGIRYLVSHDPAQRCVGIALFGRGGAGRGRAASTVAIPEDLIRTAADEFGILVVPAV